MTSTSPRGGFLISGATGFVGGALALELLARTDAPVACLVRDNGTDPGARLLRSLDAAATAYGLPAGAVEEWRPRIHAVAGDITGGLDAAERPPFEIDQVWHAAASLKYHDKDRVEIFRSNVDGTRAVTGLAGRWGAREFNHISTAYVAGRACGRIPEEPGAGDRETNNLYELSKIEAESIVRAARDRFAVRVFRPSIVVGHRATRAATTFSGLYGFTRQLLALKRESERKLGGYLSRRPVRIVADPQMPVNFVPVDQVAERAVTVALSGETAGVVHLTNATAPPVGRVLTLLFERCGLHAPAYVDDKRQFNVIDAEFDQEMNFYGSYLSGTKHFDQSPRRTPLAHDFSEETLLAYYEWYLRHLGVADKIRPLAAT